MFARKSALALGALIGLTLSHAVLAQALSAPSSRHAASGTEVAQYAGPPFEGAPQYGGPGDGYGPPPDMGGPPPGYGPGAGYGGAGYAGEPGPGASAGGRFKRVAYHGFHIDLSEGAAAGNLTRQLASIEHQIDIVDSVGLGMSNLSLFRRFPIRMSNGLVGGGHYSGGASVEMGSLATSDSRPVLLHEFMHVYHHARLPGGFQNPDVHAFYEEAVSRNLYPADSYMLTNQGEFFAMTASCYLYGTVARPPGTRETIRKQQPDYYAFLQRLFGPPHGTHSSGVAQSRLTAPGRARFAPTGEDGAYN